MYDVYGRTKRLLLGHDLNARYYLESYPLDYCCCVVMMSVLVISVQRMVKNDTKFRDVS